MPLIQALTWVRGRQGATRRATLAPTSYQFLLLFFDSLSVPVIPVINLSEM